MRVALLAAGAALAAFFVIALCLSALAALAARRLRDDDPVHAARRLFVLRLLPTLLALFAVGALALPAFLRFEPAESAETPGAAFVLLAMAGALVLAAGLGRVARDLAATRRVRRAWLREGRPLALDGAPAPAVAVAHPFPVVCVMGVLRPRIFVAEAVLRALSPAELRALLAHERAHVRAGDNLRRLALRACAPLPWPALARRLERRWQDASEGAADVSADGGLDLASALVATARLAPPGARLELGAAAFHSGGGVAVRVRRLCAADGQPARRGDRVSAGSLAAALLATLGVAAAWPQALGPAYRLLEVLVHLP